MNKTEITIGLPDWLKVRLPALTAETYATNDARMDVAVQLAAENIKQQTGGPFGAAVFDTETNRLVAVGVNLVMSTGQSFTHAEVVALAMAEAALDTFDLSTASLQLATSAEPCAMCLGAIHWSGVRSILIGARDEDIRSVGFDEGNKPSDWIAAFDRNGVEVIRDVLRENAAAVLRAYQQGGGAIYNAGKTD